jgi:hypothetical protein
VVIAGLELDTSVFTTAPVASTAPEGPRPSQRRVRGVTGRIVSGGFRARLPPARGKESVFGKWEVRPTVAMEWELGWAWRWRADGTQRGHMPVFALSFASQSGRNLTAGLGARWAPLTTASGSDLLTNLRLELSFDYDPAQSRFGCHWRTAWNGGGLLSDRAPGSGPPDPGDTAQLETLQSLEHYTDFFVRTGVGQIGAFVLGSTGRRPGVEGRAPLADRSVLEIGLMWRIEAELGGSARVARSPVTR